MTPTLFYSRPWHLITYLFSNTFPWSNNVQHKSTSHYPYNYISTPKEEMSAALQAGRVAPARSKAINFRIRTVRRDNVKHRIVGGQTVEGRTFERYV